MGYETLYEKNDKLGSMLFISHGGGPRPLINDPRHPNLIEFLKELPAKLISPSAILVISGHWEESCPTVQSSGHPPMYFDYYGFPEETYHLSYPAPGNPELASKISNLLSQQGIKVKQDSERGYDHGVFVPLMLIYPEANIPCLQLSLVDSLNPDVHINLGKAIRELQKENILIIGSGSSFHNIKGFYDIPTEETVALNHGFEDWLLDTMTSNQLSEDTREQKLINWFEAPGARYCHPREEHLLPLHVCYGIAGRTADRVIKLEVMDRRTSMYIWTE